MQLWSLYRVLVSLDETTTSDGGFRYSHALAKNRDFFFKSFLVRLIVIIAHCSIFASHPEKRLLVRYPKTRLRNVRWNTNQVFESFGDGNHTEALHS